MRFLILLVCLGAGVGAAAQPAVAVRDRVRLSLHAGVRDTGLIVGELRTVGADTIVVLTESGPLAVPAARVHFAERSVGLRRHTANGAALGAAAGAAVGALIYRGECPRGAVCFDFGRTGSASVMGAVGLVVGAIVGGRTRVEQWEPAMLP